MWVAFAFGSAIFAGLTSILAKCGIKKTDSNVATAIRTIVVLIFSWIMVFVVGAQGQITSVETKTWIFLIMSGLATGASWLCYFRALQLGDVNKVVPIDKSSTVLTMLLAFIFLREEISLLKFICVVLIGAGTFLMITRKEQEAPVEEKGHSWFFLHSSPQYLPVLPQSLVKLEWKISIPIWELRSVPLSFYLWHGLSCL